MLTRFMTSRVPAAARRSIRWVRVVWLVGFLMFAAGVVVLGIAIVHDSSGIRVTTCSQQFPCGSEKPALALIVVGIALEVGATFVGARLVAKRVGREAYRQMVSARQQPPNRRRPGQAYPSPGIPSSPYSGAPPFVPPAPPVEPPSSDPR
ncbi:MAG: hypothetical protein ACRD0Z_03775 [Acidimicrobiales bacterium]